MFVLEVKKARVSETIRINISKLLKIEGIL